MKLLDLPVKYLSEGNVHIVLQVVESNFVIRLLKEDNYLPNYAHLINSVKFVNIIMLPLLSITGNQSEIIEVPAKQLEIISQDLYNIRPTHRRHKSKFSHVAIKTNNLAILDINCEVNYCIEIKPKEGFKASFLKNVQYCYYCLKQFEKIENKKIDKISYYCPLDLFSGEIIRMKKALKSLMDNPQNNFKMFKDGDLVISEKSNKRDVEVFIKNMSAFNGSIDVFCDFVIEILLNDNNNAVLRKLSDAEATFTDKKCCVESGNLDKKSFLYRVLHLQQLTDGKSFGDKALKLASVDYADDMIKQLESNKLNLNLEKDRKLFFNTCDSMYLALVSAIMRDCSIMLSFSPNCDGVSPYIEIGDHKLYYRISLTDLEPKPVTTLLKRAKTERRLMEIYKKLIISLKNDVKSSSPTLRQEPSSLKHGNNS